MNKLIKITDRKGNDHYIGSAFIVSIMVNPRGMTIVNFQKGETFDRIATDENIEKLVQRIND